MCVSRRQVPSWLAEERPATRYSSWWIQGITHYTPSKSEGRKPSLISRLGTHIRPENHRPEEMHDHLHTGILIGSAFLVSCGSSFPI